jgi:hypothetical protein
VRAAVPWRDAHVVDYVAGGAHPRLKLTLAGPHQTLALHGAALAPRGTVSTDETGLRAFGLAARARAARYELGPAAVYKLSLPLSATAVVAVPVVAGIACALVLRTPAAPIGFVVVHTYLCAVLLLLSTFGPLGEYLELRRGARLGRATRVVLTGGADGVLHATDAAGAHLAIEVSGLSHPDAALGERRGPARVLLEPRERAADGAYRDGGVLRARALETEAYLAGEARLRRGLFLQSVARAGGAALLVALTLAAVR